MRRDVPLSVVAGVREEQRRTPGPLFDLYVKQLVQRHPCSMPRLTMAGWRSGTDILTEDLTSPKPKIPTIGLSIGAAYHPGSSATQVDLDWVVV